ncbi:MAG: Clp protease N-terminal domain-containing protein [Anaerolineae bacterium]
MSRVERFSQRARRILAAAQEEAEKLRNNTIETPHLLLGMLRVQDSVACRVLNELRIEYDRVLPVVRAAHPGEPTPAKNLALAPETKRLLESAVDVARKRGEHWIGSEHLLLALIKGEDKSVRYLMRQINLEPAVVRSCVERVLQEGGDGLPTTEPLMEEEPAKMETGPLKPSMPNDSSPRAKVLQLVESGKISASEAAELLKAMRFAAVPIPAESGFVLLPLDDVNFDELRQRTVRFAVEANGAGAEIALSFEEAQAVIFQLLREVYGGAQGTLVDLDGGNQRLHISLD